MRDSFIFFRSYIEGIDIEEISDYDFRILVRAITGYCLDDTIPELDGISKAMFSLMRPSMDKSIKRADAGRRGGSQTKANDKRTESELKANDKQNVSKTKANSKQSVTNKNKNKELELEIELEKENKEPLFESEELCKAFDEFVAFRKKIKATMTDRAIKLARNELLKMADKDDERIAIINQSIMNGWKGFYPLKENKTQTKTNRFNDFQQREYDYEALERLVRAN